MRIKVQGPLEGLERWYTIADCDSVQSACEVVKILLSNDCDTTVTLLVSLDPMDHVPFRAELID